MFKEFCCHLNFKCNMKHESMWFGMTIAEEVFKTCNFEVSFE